MDKNLLIRSQDRENYNSTNPANFSITTPRAIVATCIELLFAEISNTYYNITSKNNNITINGILYTLTAGNYNLLELLNALTTLTGDAFSYNDITSKITISHGVAKTLDFSGNNTMYKVLRFKPQLYGASLTHISDYPPKIFSNFVYITLNLASNIMTTSRAINHVSFVIPNHSNKNEINFFLKHSAFSLRPQSKEPIHKLDITIRDEDGFILEGLADWCLMLSFTENMSQTF